MTPYSTIVTILLIAALVAIVKLTIKVNNLHDELTRSEQDADNYAKELAKVKTQLDKECSKVKELADRCCELCRFASFVSNNTEKEPYSISEQHYMANFDTFDVIYTAHDRNVVVKSFRYDTGDEADKDLARLEAEDLLDALNGKVGWRKSIG